MDTAVFRSVSDVTEYVGRSALQCVSAAVPYECRIDEGYGPRKVIVAPYHGSDEPEIVIAMEGGGCMFARYSDRINPFRLIEAGFQIRAAEIVVALFASVAEARAALETYTRRAHPQLTYGDKDNAD